MRPDELTLEQRLDIIKKSAEPMKALVKDNKIAEFLEHNAFTVVLNANDTFGYACADAVDVSVWDLPKLLEVSEKFGSDGVTAFMSLVRQENVLKELQSEKYWEAVEFLKDYQPVSWVE